MNRTSAITIDEYRGLEAQCFELSALSGAAWVEPTAYDAEFRLTKVSSGIGSVFLHLAHTVRVAQTSNPGSDYESLVVDVDERGYGTDASMLLYAQRATFTILSGAVAYARNSVLLPQPIIKVPEAPPSFGYDPHREDFSDWEYELNADHILVPEEYKLLTREIAQIANLEEI